MWLKAASLVGLLGILLPLSVNGQERQYNAGGYHEAEAVWAAVWVDTAMPALKKSMSHQNISVAFVQERADITERVVLEVGVILGTGETYNYEGEPRIFLYWQQNRQSQRFNWPGQVVNGWNTISLHKTAEGYDVRINGGWWYRGYEVMFTETPRATWFAEGYNVVPPSWPHVVYLQQEGNWQETARVFDWDWN